MYNLNSPFLPSRPWYWVVWRLPRYLSLQPDILSLDLGMTSFLCLKLEWGIFWVPACQTSTVTPSWHPGCLNTIRNLACLWTLLWKIEMKSKRFLKMDLDNILENQYLPKSGHSCGIQTVGERNISSCNIPKFNVFTGALVYYFPPVTHHFLLWDLILVLGVITPVPFNTLQWTPWALLHRNKLFHWKCPLPVRAEKGESPSKETCMHSTTPR